MMNNMNMMNELKEKELTETEMNGVAGGVGYGRYDFCYNESDEKLFESFTTREKCEVLDQPDISSRRAKMFEIWRRHR